jgi:AraC-like DNA-binding protein
LISAQIFFNLNPVNFFIISGFVQNLILAGILFFDRTDQARANRHLALAILAIDLHIGYMMLLDTNLDNMFPGLLWVPLSFVTVVGPLLYFYVQERTGNSPKRIARHLVPLALELVLQVIMIAYAASHDVLFYNTPFYFYFTPIIYAIAGVSVFYYLWLSLRLIKGYETWAIDNFSNLKEVTLRWLERFIVSFRALWMVWIPFMAIFLLFFRYQLQYPVIVLTLYLLLLGLTYLAFGISIAAIRHPYFIVVPPSSERSPGKNFAKLTEPTIQSYVGQISSLMSKEKLYLNENLSLKEVASALNVDPNLISHILNSHLGKSFHDFINEYRVEAVKTKIADPAWNHMTLLGIALECGFNSKTTFNRVFRQTTGMTPTEFHRKHKNMD